MTTFDHPVQSFVWDDFTAKPDREYEYCLPPAQGQARRTSTARAPPIAIRVQHRAALQRRQHDVFFNRGVASSQAYAREFEQQEARSDQPIRAKRKEALAVAEPRPGRGALQVHRPGEDGRHAARAASTSSATRRSADALKAAIDRGVDVRLIIDAKVNELTDKDGKFHESFPARGQPRARSTKEKMPDSAIALWREAKPNDIAAQQVHGAAQGPAAHARRGVDRLDQHLARRHPRPDQRRPLGAERDSRAQQFRDYWELLAADPGAPRPATTARPRRTPRASSFRDGGRGDSPPSRPRIARTSRRAARRSSARAAGSAGARHVRRHGRRGRRRRLHHARLRHQQGASRTSSTTTRPTATSLFMLLEKEDEPNPSAKDRLRPAQRAEQHLPGVGLVHRRPALPVGARRPTPKALGSTRTSATSTRSSC